MPTAKLLSASGETLNLIELDAGCIVLNENDAVTLTLEEISSGYFYIVPVGVTVERVA